MMTSRKIEVGYKTRSENVGRQDHANGIACNRIAGCRHPEKLSLGIPEGRQVILARGVGIITKNRIHGQVTHNEFPHGMTLVGGASRPLVGFDERKR